jgi:hypothetical protein
MAYISALTFMFGQYIGRCVTCTSTRAREDVGDESMTRAAKGKVRSSNQVVSFHHFNKDLGPGGEDI